MYSNGVKAAKVKESTLSSTHEQNQTQKYEQTMPTKTWKNTTNAAACNVSNHSLWIIKDD